jgi:hypothetical protein
VLAHIGNIPVQESLPFLVPIVALFIVIRRKERRRRRVVATLPPTSAALDGAAVQRVLEAWAAADYEGVSREHLAMLYPPGPDGMSIAEIAERTGSTDETVQALLDGLQEHDYLDVDAGAADEPARALLTLKGYGLVNATEDALVSAVAEQSVR